MKAAAMTDLHQALDASLAYAATYPSGRLRLSNHLPMVLEALYRLQAPASALQAVQQLHARRLERLAPDAPESVLDEQIGAEIRRDGLSAVLARRLPNLLAASETAAFHGVIRLAHALDATHAGETARALAAWDVQRQPLGPLPETGGSEPLHALLARLADDPALAFTARQDTLITDDMQQATALPAFAAAAGALSDSGLSLDTLAEASLAVYLASRDFTALHLVTGGHALRRVLPHARLDDTQTTQVLRGVWRAWLAAWVSIGRPRPDWAAVHAGTASEADWSDALPALLAAPNDHAIKLACSARDEWRHRGWPGYARVLPTAKVPA